MIRHPEIEAMRRFWRGLRDGELAYTGTPDDTQARRLAFSVVFGLTEEGHTPVKVAGTSFKYYHARASEGHDFLEFWRPLERPLLLEAIRNAHTARAPVTVISGARNAKKATACFHILLAPLRDADGGVTLTMATLVPTASLRAFVEYPISEHALIAARAAVCSKAPPPRAQSFAMLIAAASVAHPR